MGIISDLEELKGIWPKLPFTLKVFFVITFALSCLSIASIGDSIYQFRGFINVAISFYQSHISPMVINLLSLVDIKISQTQADTMLFISVINASLIRANYFCKYYHFTADVLTWFLFMWLTYKTPDNAVFGLVYGYLGIVIFFAFLSIVAQRFAQFKILATYKFAAVNIIGVLLVVGIIGAISEGLSRAS